MVQADYYIDDESLSRFVDSSLSSLEGSSSTENSALSMLGASAKNLFSSMGSGNRKTRDAVSTTETFSRRCMLSKAVHSSCSRMLAENDINDEDNLNQSFEFAVTEQEEVRQPNKPKSAMSQTHASSPALCRINSKKEANKSIGNLFSRTGSLRCLSGSSFGQENKIFGGSSRSLGNNHGSNHSLTKRKSVGVLAKVPSFRKRVEDDPRELSRGSSNSSRSGGVLAKVPSFRKYVEDDTRELSRGSNHSSKSKRRSGGVMSKVPSFRKRVEDDPRDNYNRLFNDLTSAETLAILLARELELCDC
jgi:hypothetical protein